MSRTFKRAFSQWLCGSALPSAGCMKKMQSIEGLSGQMVVAASGSTFTEDCFDSKDLTRKEMGLLH